MGKFTKPVIIFNPFIVLKYDSPGLGGSPRYDYVHDDVNALSFVSQ